MSDLAPIEKCPVCGAAPTATPPAPAPIPLDALRVRARLVVSLAIDAADVAEAAITRALELCGRCASSPYHALERVLDAGLVTRDENFDEHERRLDALRREFGRRPPASTIVPVPNPSSPTEPTQ